MAPSLGVLHTWLVAAAAAAAAAARRSRPPLACVGEERTDPCRGAVDETGCMGR